VSGVYTTYSCAGNCAGEREHDKLFAGATGEESVACKLEARATVQRERGRDGPISWGTARMGSSRRQTHRVGNQAVGACDTNSCAWRNHVMRASWDADR
jgi:hypothetical protein